jgi:hypothetical protein
MPEPRLESGLSDCESRVLTTVEHHTAYNFDAFIKWFLFCVFQSLTDDVARQTERERELQRRYAELQQQKDDLLELMNQ